MSRIERIRQLNDETTEKILLLRKRRLEREQEKQLLVSEKPEGHPMVNWAIAQLHRLNRWLISKGWA